MAQINAKMVKDLRESTGAGMMDCKKALVEADGDAAKAVEILREKGLGKAAKKADRVASEGLIHVEVAGDLNKASVVEINSETDFVAKNDDFVELVKTTTKQVFDNEIASVEALNDSSLNGSKFLDFFNEKVAKIGEKIETRRMETIKAGANEVLNGYVHSNGRVGVIIKAECENADVAKKAGEFIRQLCMHAAAMKPSFLSYKELDPAFVESENKGIIADIEKENEELARLKKPLKKIPEYVSMSQLTDDVMAKAEEKIKAELKEQGKPEKIWDKIIPGSMARFIADNTQLDQQMTLLSQFFVMDDKKTIEQVVEEKSKEFGGKITLTKYVRFELGDGLEKKEDNFADEVAAQLK